jgi:hypothetical protein
MSAERHKVMDGVIDTARADLMAAERMAASLDDRSIA